MNEVEAHGERRKMEIDQLLTEFEKATIDVTYGIGAHNRVWEQQDLRKKIIDFANREDDKLAKARRAMNEQKVLSDSDVKPIVSRRYWYHITYTECVLCGRGDTIRERRYDPKPDEYNQRVGFEQYACEGHF
jgi:hypothetical protein